MEIRRLFVLLISGVSVLGSAPSQTKQYRTDFVYNRKTDSFYKLHTETRQGWDVAKVCEAEGAILMVPSSQLDIVQLHEMFKQFPDIGDLVWVGKDGQSHESAEEQPIVEIAQEDEEKSIIALHSTVKCDVVNRKGEIESCYCEQQLPFICKVEAKDAPYDNHCGVLAKNYKYLSATGSCYKIPPIAYSWNEAYSECRAEGAHLLVLNSETEMLAVKHMVQAEPLVPEAVNPHYLHIGFREVLGKNPREFRTVFNQTLEEAGYSGWALTEPNDRFGGEPCGSIFDEDGKLNDISCTDRYGFICEKEIVMTDRHV